LGRKVVVQVSKPGVEVSEANATHVDSSSVDVVEAELEAVGDVVTNRGQSGGEKMDMTTPVIQQVHIFESLIIPYLEPL
jgi:hypothetical protein